MKTVLTSKYIFDGASLLSESALLIDERQIISIIKKNAIEAQYKDIKVIDYGEAIISHAFIDLQINGAMGVLFNDNISEHTLESLYEFNKQCGVCSFLPTLISTKFEDVEMALKVVYDWIKKYKFTRGVCGIHLEGPFISAARKGAHKASNIIKPERVLLEHIVKYSQEFPIMLTIAPEEFKAEDIKYLNENNIIVSIGHSNCTYDEAVSAMRNGAISTTHTFNAMSGLGARDPGLIAASLNLDLYNGVIVDLIHVAIPNLQILYKLKADKMFIVTDSITVTGSSLNSFKLSDISYKISSDSSVRDANGNLGGANTTIIEEIKNCITKCGFSIVDTLKMATIIPARLIKNDSFGKLNVGTSIDDIVIIDANNYTLITKKHNLHQS